MKLLKSILFAVLAIPIVGALLLGALVTAALTVQHYGGYGGFPVLIAFILYGAVVVIPVSFVLQWLAQKLI